MAAQEKLQVPRLIQAALRQHLIVIDELGFIPFTTQGAQLFFQFCAAVYDRVALIITPRRRTAATQPPNIPLIDS